MDSKTVEVENEKTSTIKVANSDLNHEVVHFFENVNGYLKVVKIN